MEDELETCSWCCLLVPFNELEQNEQPDGALICNDCAKGMTL